VIVYGHGSAITQLLTKSVCTPLQFILAHFFLSIPLSSSVCIWQRWQDAPLASLHGLDVVFVFETRLFEEVLFDARDRSLLNTHEAGAQFQPLHVVNAACVEIPSVHYTCCPHFLFILLTFHCSTVVMLIAGRNYILPIRRSLNS